MDFKIIISKKNVDISDLRYPRGSQLKKIFVHPRKYLKHSKIPKKIAKADTEKTENKTEKNPNIRKKS